MLESWATSPARTRTAPSPGHEAYRTILAEHARVTAPGGVTDAGRIAYQDGLLYAIVQLAGAYDGTLASPEVPGE